MINPSYSYIIDRDGKIIKINDGGGGVLVDSVGSTQSRTLYTLVGEWVAYLSLILTGALVMILYKHKHKH